MDLRVQDLLKRTATVFRGLRVPYAVGGAMAMSAHGYSRYTSDVDVFALDRNRQEILRAFRANGLTVEPIFTPHHYIAYLPEHKDPRVRIDVLFPAGEPDLSAVEFPARAKVSGVLLNVFPVNLLVAAKFYSDRPEDHHDISAMLNRGVFEPEEVQRVIASIDPEGAVEFAKEIQDLKTPRVSRKKPTRK